MARKENERNHEKYRAYGKAIFKAGDGGIMEYMTLTEFRERLESKTMELPMFDEAGCGCFTDDDQD